MGVGVVVAVGVANANEAHCLHGPIGAGGDEEEYEEYEAVTTAAIEALADWVEVAFPDIATGVVATGDTVVSRIRENMPGIVSAIVGEESPERIANGSPETDEIAELWDAAQISLGEMMKNINPLLGEILLGEIEEYEEEYDGEIAARVAARVNEILLVIRG